MSNEVEIQNLTEKDFNEKIIESSTPALIDFWADWCAPCHKVAPIVEKIAKAYEGQLIVGKVDVDNEQGLAQSFGIRSIPALLLFRDGKVVDQIGGAVPFGQLSASVDRVLENSERTREDQGDTTQELHT